MSDTATSASAPSIFIPDSPAAWRRLLLALAIGAMGSVGLWSAVVALPVVQVDFGSTRGTAALAVVAANLGFGVGGVLTGRLTDRFGIVTAIAAGIVALLAGYAGISLAGAQWQFSALHFLIGIGASATFAPLMAEASHWFVKRRGIAVSIAASGNYVAGAIWPPLIERGMATFGWRPTHLAVGIACAIGMSVLLMVLRASMRGSQRRAEASLSHRTIDLGISANALTVILSLAAIACCVAMAMPQVHIVAYCGDLGYGMARGAEMLSIMLGLGIISRVGSGFIADRFGGVVTLLIGSAAQALALTLYMFFDSMASLYVISALFGLFQGGIVPSYTMIIRETMPGHEAATRVGIVIMASVIGMSFGGWISGVIFDATGSYRAAFLNGLAWNALNLGIALMLLTRGRRRLAAA